MTEETRFLATNSSCEVSALLMRPDDARCTLVLGHGAGAGMRHPFMESLARRLAERGVATFRYQFPYMEQGKRPPSPQPILLKTVRSAVAAAPQDLPLFAGGKSMGGRMTSIAASKEPLPGVKGLVFIGFPLHPTGKPGTARGDHLADVTVPMLFLQGTRDKLADVALLSPIVDRLDARMNVIDGGDHSFHMLKRSGRTDDDALDELADAVAAFTATD